MGSPCCQVVVKEIEGEYHQRYPDHVDQNRHGYAGDKEDGSQDIGSEGEITHNGAEGQQHGHGPEAAARLDHLEGPVREVDHIPFPIHRQTKDIAHRNAGLGYKELQRDGELGMDLGRHRDHKQEKKQGEAQFLEHAEPMEIDNRAGNHQDHGKSFYSGDLRQVRNKIDHQGHNDDGQAPTRRVHLYLGQAFPLLPDNIGANREDKESVRIIIRGVPHSYQAFPDREVGQEECPGQQDGQTDCREIEWGGTIGVWGSHGSGVQG